MRKVFCLATFLFFLALSPAIALGAEVIKLCHPMEAAGDGCVFDVRANANVLLQVDTRALTSGQRWRVTFVEVGKNDLSPSNGGTGSTTNFTGLAQRQVVSGKQYELIVTYERPLTGAAAVFPTNVRVRFRFPLSGQVTVSPARGNFFCDPSYPTVCIPPPPPDLDCGEIPYRNFRVLPPDPHRFDGDKDGIGCET